MPIFSLLKAITDWNKIQFRDLLFIQSLQNYVVFHTVDRKYISYLTLTSAGVYLPSPAFLKINKSTIVSLAAIEHISGSDIHIGNQILSISRAHKEIVMAQLESRILRR